MKTRHRFALLAAWLTAVVPAMVAAESATTREVVSVLTAQTAAWNRGDIEGFMQGYAPTEALRFASGGTVTRGWRSTLERYRQRYPDRATMGKLEFTEIEVTELGADAAIAFGRWQLIRTQDAPSGLFTLTLRKTAAGWKIIQDHTSSG